MKVFYSKSGKTRVFSNPEALAKFRELITDERDYTWGPLTAIHVVGPYVIVESHPCIAEGCTVTNRVDPAKFSFHPYIEISHLSPAVHGWAKRQDGSLNAATKYTDTNQSFGTLDEALAGAIAYRQEGCNHRADQYFISGMRS